MPSDIESLVDITTKRGRGRPAKPQLYKPKFESDGDDVPEKKEAVKRSASEMAGGSIEESKAAKIRRGRPAKKGKVKLLIFPTGKGRGRPKKAKLHKQLGDGKESSNDANLRISKLSKKKAGKQRGRPRKAQNSDDESSDDKLYDGEEKRGVGRPATGAINLNIVRTGRGQGRPRKIVEKKKAAVPSNAVVSLKKRGRPSLSGSVPYKPTGKPRGRPKANINNDFDMIEKEMEAIHSDII